jgi:low affinity Fe/Cu permease
MAMSVPAAVLVVMTLIVVAAHAGQMLDVARVAVLTVNMSGAVGCDRCRIGV